MKKKICSSVSKIIAQSKFNHIFWIALFVIGAFYALSPLLVEFKQTIYAIVLEFIVFLLIAIIVSFEKKIPLIGKIVVISLPILIFIINLIPTIGRIGYLMLLIYSGINVLVSIHYYKKRKKSYNCIYLFGVYSYIQVLFLCLKTQTVDYSFPFWKISLIISILSFVVALIIMIRKYKKDHRF